MPAPRPPTSMSPSVTGRGCRKPLPVRTIMENVRELPAESTPAILDGLGIQQHLTATALSDVARIRKEAHAEIGRLISFLDQSDEYVMTELEEESEDEGAQCQGGGGEEG